jgi:hypothetical protein
MRQFTRKDREAILHAFVVRHGGAFDPAAFVDEVEAAGDAHPAYRWFEWDTEAAARQHRLEQARAFARGIKVVFRVEDIGGGTIRVRELMVPFLISPIDGRRDGGGYVETAAGGGLHLAEYCRQAARDLEAWARRYESAVVSSGSSLREVEQLIARLQDAASPRDEAA